MLRGEHIISKACVGSLEVLKKLANISLRFRGFKDKNTLPGMYLNVENKK